MIRRMSYHQTKKITKKAGKTAQQQLNLELTLHSWTHKKEKIQAIDAHQRTYQYKKPKKKNFRAIILQDN